MSTFSRVLLCAVMGALIAGCGSAPYRAGKGNDHEVVYRPNPAYQQQREVVYVERTDPYVYYEPVPAYRVVQVQPTYRVVPVTRYYYVEQ
jgi:hypothetical protein